MGLGFIGFDCTVGWIRVSGFWLTQAWVRETYARACQIHVSARGCVCS